MTRLAALAGAGLFALTAGAAATNGAADAAAARIEARSADLMAVGVVRDDRMIIHVSRLLDNAPVTSATLVVLLRGVTHPTTAEADGAYTLQTQDLRLPGAAAVIFQVTRDGAREDLKGSFAVAGEHPAKEQNSARQLGWWVLNFAVCIGFLMLLARRRKTAVPD